MHAMKTMTGCEKFILHKNPLSKKKLRGIFQLFASLSRTKFTQCSHTL